MKTAALPKQLDMRGLAARGVHIEGTVSPEDLPRLADLGIAIADSGSAAFDFGRDEEARYVVAVCVEAKVVMQCQRCLRDMEVPIKSASLMACVWTDEEGAALPVTYEPLLVDDNADLSNIAEEESAYEEETRYQKQKQEARKGLGKTIGAKADAKQIDNVST